LYTLPLLLTFLVFKQQQWKGYASDIRHSSFLPQIV